MTTKIEQIHAIASRSDLTVLERHQQLLAVDRTAALSFSRIHHAAIALETRNAEAATAKQEQAQAQADAARLAEQLPATPHLTKFEATQKTDPVAASIFHHAHAVSITRERAERDAALAELNSGPDAA